MMPNYHESRTPQTHIDAVKTAMQSLEQLSFVRSAWADDWGRFSNFSLFVEVGTSQFNRYMKRSPVLQDPKGLAKLKKALLAELTPRFPDQEVRIRSTSREGGTYSLDLDFYAFDESSNTFPGKLAA